ncbi:MAG TPA: ATP-binding protein, partial [Chryseosolibacter sp.]
RLINDLLAFSRIGKKELSKSVVNMNDMVQDVFGQASQTQVHKAALSARDLPVAFGDYSMLHQVWSNLISNAIKYSSKKDNSTIEIGGCIKEGRTEYYIRDNGAGFDMAYAGKLFGTFQRLHDSSEFEGVGMGLAIAQRIILKHGGTIRAEAVPEQGATFIFSLPPDTR